ncbi:MAG: DDE-type integrase/transposase/recombinase [Croceibacterium sp.]
MPPAAMCSEQPRCNRSKAVRSRNSKLEAPSSITSIHRLTSSMKKALKRYGNARKIFTGGLKSYPAALKELGNEDRRELGRWLNNRAENSHLPLR